MHHSPIDTVNESLLQTLAQERGQMHLSPIDIIRSPIHTIGTLAPIKNRKYPLLNESLVQELVTNFSLGGKDKCITPQLT